ncbi:MAG: DHHW family protein [bacterium]|nr:DHHW family protein [bacterium]
MKVIAAILAAFAAAGTISAAAADKAFVTIDNVNRTISFNNGEKTDIDAPVFSNGAASYVPVDYTLKAAGYGVGWDSSDNSVTISNTADDTVEKIYVNSNWYWNGWEMKYNDNPTIYYHDMLYMPLDMFDMIAGSWLEFRLEGDIRQLPQNNLEDAAITDKYRYDGKVTVSGSPAFYGNVYVMENGYGFERITIPEENITIYANAVNKLASLLPENVGVYNILVPNSAEIYAPKEYLTNIADSYKRIYSLLDGRITGVNVYDSLFDHGNEHIYFNTDHHWTQRGAYYAYRTFAECAGKEPVSMSSFAHSDADGMVGSYKTMTEGFPEQAIFEAHPERLERFMPKNKYSQRVYTDSHLQNYKYEDILIHTEKSFLSYDSFLGGDYPMADIYNSDLNDGSKLLIIKESYGNAFTVWAMNNYEHVYVVDLRCFNGYSGYTEPFNLREFYELTQFDDMVVISYPNTVANDVLCSQLDGLAGYNYYYYELD